MKSKTINYSMTKQIYKPISKEWLRLMKGQDVFSIESMEAHGAKGRKVEYIGSEITGCLDNDEKNGLCVRDYFWDEKGKFWHQTRAMLPSGEIVSMEMYLFGYEGERKPYSSRARKRAKRL